MFQIRSLQPWICHRKQPQHSTELAASPSEHRRVTGGTRAWRYRADPAEAALV